MVDEIPVEAFDTAAGRLDSIYATALVTNTQSTGSETVMLPRL